MNTQHEDVRDDLVAALHAAAELPADDREHLADVFLDRLEGEYRLVSRHPAPVTRQYTPAPPPPRTRRGSPPVFKLLAVMFVGIWLIPGVFALHHILPVLILAAILIVAVTRRPW